MPRPRRNPGDLFLGLVGFLFVVTAACYCVTVLRGVRPAADVPPHPLDRFMADHGTTALVVELGLLAVATFASIAIDEISSREPRRLLAEERDRAARATSGGAPASATGAAPPEGRP